jgi:hypothetical protein
MRKIRTFWALLPLLFLLTACPYSAEFPLDTPSQPINKALLGKWVEVSNSGTPSENPEFFVITDAGNKTYQFEKNSYDTNENAYKKESMKGYFTPIGKTMFLNLQKADDTNYYFYKIEMTDKEFSMFEVTDNIDEKFANVKELKAFFDKYKDLSFFYNKDEKKYQKK